MAIAVTIIPARYASTRLPGKMLLDETGKPLIQHVVENTLKARSVQRVIVATDDERILKAVRSFGGDAVMTRADHASGSDRIAEAVESIDCDIVLNVQGDEPNLEPAVMDEVVSALDRDAEAVVATAAVPITSAEDFRDPNVVKVVLDGTGGALYFSRAPIPHAREGWDGVTTFGHKHFGVYAYRRAFLLQYARMTPTPLEALEKLEQLRILENGGRIRVVVVHSDAHGIDTPRDYRRFVQRMKGGSRS